MGAKRREMVLSGFNEAPLYGGGWLTPPPEWRKPGGKTASMRYEQWCRGLGAEIVAGVDEAGAGALAGPVVAAAVALPPDAAAKLRGVRDSKTLSPEAREKLYFRIRRQALAMAAAFCSAQEVDRLNVYQASLLAMRRAVEKLRRRPDHFLVDARTIPGLSAPQLALIKGDGLSLSIAAASIVAKVTRDRMMNLYALRWPQYGFASHKGYGTAGHVEAIRKYGPLPDLHRMSYKPLSSAL